MKITSRLKDTDKKHSDFIDAYAYMIAAQEADLLNKYVLLHIKKKPWFLPKKLYDWILSKILVLSTFQKHD